MLHHATPFAHSTSLPTSWIRSGSCIQRFTKSGRALGSVGCPSCVSSPDQEPVPLAKSKLFHHGEGTEISQSSPCISVYSVSPW